MRNIFFATFFLTVAMTTLAVPAKRGIWKNVKLADGTEVRAELRGDEYLNYWQSADGNRYVRSADGQCFMKADMQALQARAIEMRCQNPLPQRSVQSNKTVTDKTAQRISLGGTHPAFVGSKKGLIILAEFKDKKFQQGHDAAYYERLANETDFESPDGHVGSIHDYFFAQSEGQFDLTFDVVGPIQLQYNTVYYGGHDVTSGVNDKNPGAMVREAVVAAAQQLGSFAQYDWFGDGYVDQVYVIYAGRGEADGGSEETIWPHRSSISKMLLGGKYVSVYACSNELQTDTMIDGIGAFCHEFSHCLGLADLYDVQYGAYNDGVENYGMGYWDIMCSGSYLGSSFRPCSYSGYERNYCGWKTPVVLTDDTEVRDVKGISEGGDYYIIYNDAYTNEYYILENRNQTGWDAEQFGSGLLITHIDFDASIWAKNLVNSQFPNVNDHTRYAAVLADGKTANTAQDIANDLFPYRTNNRFTNYSAPSAMLYHPNAVGELFLSKPVTNIVRNDDGTVSFSFANEVGKSDDEPMPEGCVFRETFRHSEGLGGNDNLWSGTDVGLGNFVADNEGWTAAQKFAGNQCARFGTNTQRGNATTPEFSIDGDMEVSFLAAPWTNEATSLTLSIASGTATLEKASFTLASGQWTQCRTKLSGTGKIKLKFASNKARIFLDEVFVMDGSVSAISSVTDQNTTSNSPAYNLAGQKVNAGFRGIVIKQGKKIKVTRHL